MFFFLLIIVDPNESKTHKPDRKISPGVNPLKRSADTPNSIGPITPPTSPAVKYSPPAAPVFSLPTKDIRASIIIGMTPLEEIPSRINAPTIREFSKNIKQIVDAAAIENKENIIALCDWGVAIWGIITDPIAPVATGIAASKPAFDEPMSFSIKISGSQLLVA